ncbi:LytTR family transcriptional regulator DNA-binding domain-containing protein [Paenibacillus sp. GCM10012307]|uniref:LytTR family transcriptional regulator DNA-binding domain-containing protein n=1 Tax=Paenibacillus roseus TaxID=2798579 RepID=A0A934MUD9_9BACL|nr:LytTR family transcriptional regulator DNA-binding domain-containing protein [Paenibacillus roseus]MBJ6360987.1 LytTR family transcriptional regulator DNA-binding domain-containing protein [Paenibacillus roseus]
MGVALETKNVYENFEVETDILFFKVGSLGMVSFHGRNYNIKKRLSAEQLKSMISKSCFVQVKSDCYVNLGRISAIENDLLYFGPEVGDVKTIPVTKRKQAVIRELLKKQY